MDPYIGEIRLFSGRQFVPEDWLLCDGSVLNVQQYSALYAVIGNMYGGNAPTTFALPNLIGRVAVGQGNGPGLTPRVVAQSGGAPTVTLTQNQLPNHGHDVNCNTAASATVPTGNVWASAARTAAKVYAATPSTAMNPGVLSSTGGNQSHNNLQPYMTLVYMIALNGVFPVRP